MNKILLFIILCLSYTSIYAQSRAYKDSLWYFTTHQKEEIAQFDTIEDCTVCANITMSGQLIMVGLDHVGEDCDSTFNIKLDSMSIVILNKICSRYNKSVKHIGTLHAEVLCSHQSQSCEPCKQLHYTPPCITCLDSNISVSGRLIIDRGHKKSDTYRPEFEIHPVYAIKRD
jgi:hypothetical protein